MIFESRDNKKFKLFIKKVFILGLFLFVFLIGAWWGRISLNQNYFGKAKLFFSKLGFFKAALISNPIFSEELKLSSQKKTEGIESLVEQVKIEKRDEEEKRKKVGEKEIGKKKTNLKLRKIQESLDDISEKIDILNQEVLKLAAQNNSDLLSKQNGNYNDGAFNKENLENKEKISSKNEIAENPDKRSKENNKNKSEEKNGGNNEKSSKKKLKEQKLKNTYIFGGGGKGESGGLSQTPSYCSKTLGIEPAADKAIINEIAWMGSAESSANEWIELKNVSGGPLDISGWQILDKQGQIKVIFNSEKVIPEGGFYLLERTDDNSVPALSADLIYKGALNDKDEILYLFDQNCGLQDKAAAEPDWPAGNKEEKRTMERKSDLGWRDYFGQGENKIMGTPGRENSKALSPSLPAGEEKCPDIDKDGKINISDLVLVRSALGLKSGDFGWKEELDLNGDKKTSEEDLEYLRNYLGRFSAESPLCSEKKKKDNNPPEISFVLQPFQPSSRFTIIWRIIDKSSGADSPSGLEEFVFRWKKENEDNWIEKEYQKILGRPLVYSEETEFSGGKDGERYYFQVKAKDAAGNESGWRPEPPAFTTIRLPRKILINEIQIDSRAGPGGAENDWVELYNPNSGDISLEGWSIQEHSFSEDCSLNVGFSKKNFLSQSIISAKGFFLIVGTKASQSLKDVADMTISWSLTNDNTVYLVENQDIIENGRDSDIIDRVGLGKSCFPEKEAAYNPEQGKSLERRELGSDTDNNSQDFVVEEKSSPTNSKGETYYNLNNQ